GLIISSQLQLSTLGGSCQSSVVSYQLTLRREKLLVRPKRGSAREMRCHHPFYPKSLGYVAFTALIPALMSRTSDVGENMRQPLEKHISACSGLAGTTPHGFLCSRHAAATLSIALIHFSFQKSPVTPKF